MSIPRNLDLLARLKLTGMTAAYEEQRALPDIQTLSFDERLTLLLDHEWHARETKRTEGRLKRATLKYRRATIEDLSYHHRPGLERAVVLQLAQCDWVRQHQNVLICGPTGSGKSFLACSLATEAARKGYTIRYVRLARLLHDLAVARADGTYTRALDKLAKIDVLTLDDLGTAALAEREQRDLLEVLEDRAAQRATIVTSQLPVEQWYDLISQPTLADAILDRLVHHAHRVTLTGESLRRRQPVTAEAGTVPGTPGTATPT